MTFNGPRSDVQALNDAHKRICEGGRGLRAALVMLHYQNIKKLVFRHSTKPKDLQSDVQESVLGVRTRPSNAIHVTMTLKRCINMVAKF
jgi:hypothetical protein